MCKGACNGCAMVVRRGEQGVQDECAMGVQGVQGECAEVCNGCAMGVQGVQGECAKGRTMRVHRSVQGVHDECAQGACKGCARSV